MKNKTLTSAIIAACLALAPTAYLAESTAGTIDQTITGSVSQYSSPDGLNQFGSKAGSVKIKPASATLIRGLNALDKKDIETALAARQSLRAGTLERKLLAWSIAKYGRGVDVSTLTSIANDLAHWPSQRIIRANIEKALVKTENSSALLTAFSASSPETLDAAMAFAKLHAKAGRKKKARAVIAPFWRNRKLDKKTETKIKRDFGRVLLRSDHRARVEYLLSKRRIRAAERIAGLAGVTRLVAARAAVERKQKSASAKLKAVPASQKSDANYLLSKARYLRRKDRVTQAANTLLSASVKSIHKKSANRYYQEQRIVASDLIEAKKYKLAYKLAAHNVASSASKRIDAEFYAGWIALRKLGDPATASLHFNHLLKIASKPLSISRGHYWLARAYSKAGNKKVAKQHFAKAAKHDTTYYGQLAKRRLGGTKIDISNPRPSRQDRKRFPKYELVQAISKLESAGHPKRARTLYRFLARGMESSGELALLAARAEKNRDYQLSLQVGKIAFQRGRNVDTLSWPIGAIPTHTKTGKVGLPLAYAISRQESTFQIDARSHANALGLMQLLPTTAKNTARKIGIRYSKAKLTRDPLYNARLGTAYLDEQMKRFGGSYILTFAAYNAGPLRAKEWVERFGDPRGASTNFAIDWVEQIPFSETRNYVQRVLENLQVYNARLKKSKLTTDRALTKGRGV